MDDWSLAIQIIARVTGAAAGQQRLIHRAQSQVQQTTTAHRAIVIDPLAAVDRREARDTTLILVFIYDICLAQPALWPDDIGVIGDLDDQIAAILRRIVGIG